MGILDDAIRQHLDLKRRQGANEDELARLEGEAFGPPTRPGEPDFPATGEEEQVAAVAEAPPEERAAPEPEATALAEPQVTEPPAPQPQPAQPAAEPAAEQGSFYDQTSEEEDLELEDLDLELDELEPEAEPEPEAAPVEAQEPGAPATAEHAAAEPPIEALDTVEHPAPVEAQDTVEHDVETDLSHDAETEYEPLTGEEEVVEGSVVEEQAELEEGEEAEEGDAEEGDAEEEEDVLEETPEFLRDQPEDDELWFEQGEPKDFDF